MTAKTIGGSKLIESGVTQLPITASSIGQSTPAAGIFSFWPMGSPSMAAATMSTAASRLKWKSAPMAWPPSAGGVSRCATAGRVTETMSRRRYCTRAT